jgi:hypothetical protein
MEEKFLNSVKKQFKYYKILGEKTFGQLTDKEIFYKFYDEGNSIAIIVNHLSGNMLSRWTDFLTTDGEKEWRNRDSEFEDKINNRKELIEKWNSGWKALFDALNSVSKDNFYQEIFIRNQSHTIVEAINRQLAHYAYHIGQIVLLGKTLKQNNWKSLSIPKGKSKLFNKEKFEKGKHKGHFTDDIL